MRGWTGSHTISRRHAIVAAVAATAVGGTALAWPARGSSGFHPGAAVLDIDLGGLSRSEAEAKLRARLAAFAGTAVTFRWEERAWPASAADLGVTVDYEATLEAAWRHGRHAGPLGRYAALFGADRHRAALPIVLTVDVARLDAFLTRLAADVARPAEDARLAADGATIAIVPGRSGVALDRAAARQDTLAAVGQATPSEVLLRPAPVPPVAAAADLEASRAAAEQLLSGPVTIALDDRRWSGRWTSWLRPWRSLPTRSVAARSWMRRSSWRS